MIEEDTQQPVFGATERHQRVVCVEQVAGGRVQGPFAEAQPTVRLGRDAEIGRLRAGAA